MRIAILADPMDNQQAGIHVFTTEMVHALIRNFPEHEFILIREKKDPDLRNSNVEQIALWNIRLPIFYASFRLFILIPLLLNFRKVDYIIEPAHFGPFNFKPSMKRVTIIHDLTPILFPHLHRWHSQILQRIFLKRILKKADLIVANSANTKSDIANTYPSFANKTHRIYPGAPSCFKPKRDAELVATYIDSPYFISVGTLEPRKNIVVMLQAYDQFRKQGGNHKLLLIGGKGWKSDAIFDAISNHPYRGDIIQPGFVPTEHLPALYTAATALIYPSLYEGFGLPVLEAISCGTVPILANNSSLPEVGGACALYFETNDIDTLAAHMTKISREVHILDDALKAQAARFSWDRFAAELIELLKEHLNR